MVEPAFEMLMRAIESDDVKSGVRAAEVILDRAGFGPKSTLVVDDQREADLSQLTEVQLAERAMLVASKLRQAADAATSKQVIPFPDNDSVN